MLHMTCTWQQVTWSQSYEIFINDRRGSLASSASSVRKEDLYHHQVPSLSSNIRRLPRVSHDSSLQQQFYNQWLMEELQDRDPRVDGLVMNHRRHLKDQNKTKALIVVLGTTATALWHLTSCWGPGLGLKIVMKWQKCNSVKHQPRSAWLLVMSNLFGSGKFFLLRVARWVRSWSEFSLYESDMATLPLYPHCHFPSDCKTSLAGDNHLRKSCLHVFASN